MVLVLLWFFLIIILFISNFLKSLSRVEFVFGRVLRGYIKDLIFVINEF